ncbi:MAG: RIP metalloprotease RseP [Novosphingobium sp.]
MLQSPSILLTLFAFLLLLAPLVVIHELGHYLVARWCGVKADVFSVGFGKELLGWTDKRGTRWKLSSLPLGGYVQFAGDWNAISMPDAAATQLPPDELAKTFHIKPLWQRALIVSAGPLTNLLFAVIIFAAFNLAYGKVVASTEIARFGENSPAMAAGMKLGDRIESIDGREVVSFTDIPELVAPFPGKTLSIVVSRAGENLKFNVPARAETESDRFGNEGRVGRIGIGAGKITVVPVGPIEAVTLSGSQTLGVMRMMVTGLGQIISGERSVKELGGPIKIAKYSGEQLSLGWLSFATFAALISINLAFINFLPIPGLDGGHLAFYAAEAVRRKPLNARSQEWAFRAGMALVLALMVFVTLNDIVGLPWLIWFKG